MGAGGQEWKMGDHAGATDPQTQLKAIVIKVLRRTVARIGVGFETPIPRTAGIPTDRQRQRVNELNRGHGLATDHRQAPLNRRFDRPEVGRLAHEQGPIRQAGEEMSIVGPKVPIEVLVGTALKVFATNLHGDDLFVGQRGGKPAMAYPVGGSEDGVVLTHQTVHRDDKIVAIHWTPPGKTEVGDTGLTHENSQIYLRSTAYTNFKNRSR